MVILTNFLSISGNFGDIFLWKGLYSNSWWPWFSVKWTEHNFGASGQKYSPTLLKTERVAETALLASWVWPTSGRYSETSESFSSPLDAKLSPDGLVLQWNGQSKTFWTLSLKLVGRNIATLYYKTETVAETALRASWFWSTSARIPGTWGIFSSPADSKLTPDGLGLP